MLINTAYILAAFTSPENIGTGPASLFWMFPLTILGAAAYKAMKLPSIKLLDFIREIAALFGFLIISVIMVAAVLYGITWFFTQ